MSEDMILCDAYKTASKEETYLFVDKRTGLEQVPEALLQKFPNPELVTTFKLGPDRKMARVDASRVLQAIREQGYFLQMPPPKDAHLAVLSAKNEKLPR
ncbi:MAG: YcgL domain-containing protein [Pseudomonadales bacterium]